MHNRTKCDLVASKINLPGLIIPTRSRREIEDAIERLIELLDHFDPDPEFEDCGDDEPSLGWTATGAWGSDGCNGLESEAVNV